MVDAGASSALRSWAMVDYDKRVAAREEAERLRSRGFWLGVRWLAVRCTDDVCAERFLDPARSRNGDGPGFRLG